MKDANRGRLPLVVGILGKKRSGKDTVGCYLRERRGYRTMAYADALKEALLIVNPLVKDGLRLGHFIDFLGWEGAKTFPETRRLLQTFGDATRHLDPDIYLGPVSRAIDEAHVNDRRLAITDVRRKNEADLICQHGGLLLRVTRPGFDTGDTHISETDLDDYAPVVDVENDGTILDLWAKVDRILRTH